jgi:ribosomal protein L37AE/L43A
MVTLDTFALWHHRCHAISAAILRDLVPLRLTPSVVAWRTSGLPPSPIMEMLIAVGVLVLGVVWTAAVRARTARRLHKAESLRDERACWVCSSEDLQRLAEGAYRCRSCGGLQGFLAHKHRDAARVAGYANLTPDARLALAAEHLSAARL